MTESPRIASPDDIPLELAVSAYSNTSHVPEERAKQARESYAEEVNGLYEALFAKAGTEGQKALLAEEMERYRQGYIERYSALLQSQSRCASSMITGPANFPVRQQQKRSQAADNKRDELLEWRAKARKAIERKVLDAAPEEAKVDARWAALEKDIKSSLAEIEAIDEHGSPYTRSSFVNSIAGKVERLAESGEVELVERATNLIREYNDAHKKPAISARNGFWQLDEVARERMKAHDAALSAEPEVLGEKEGVQVISNPQIDRIQIVFASKPDSVTLGALTKAGWHFSRAEEAWQRKITNAAIFSAKKITGIE